MVFAYISVQGCVVDPYVHSFFYQPNEPNKDSMTPLKSMEKICG